MTLLTTTGSAILRPEQVGPLLVHPVLTASIAAAVCTTVFTTSHEYRQPVVTADPQAAWTPEATEIAPSDMTLSELLVTPRKLAGLSIISSELANDTSPAAAAAVGQGLARDIARRLDLALFGNTIANGPSGLGSLSGVSTVDTDGTVDSLDVFAEALAAAEEVGATLTSWVASPADALALALVRKAVDSNEPLLSVDGPSSATSRSILGIPLHVSPAVEAGTIWGIPKDRCVLVIRQDSTVETSTDAYFSSDRVGIRAIMRATFAYPHQQAIIKMTNAA